MNTIDLIGNTPIVQLKNIDKNIYCKLENKNPGGSIKDRSVLGMILGLEKKGLLKPNSHIVEASSGNTGIALSMIGAIKGYSITIIMPSSMSKERQDIIRSYGAELILTDSKLGMQGSVDAMNKILENGTSISLSQFDNKDNPKFHYQTTGPEIVKEVSDIDIFVAGFGTGGTISGVGRFLKEYNPNIKIIGIEPEKSALVSKSQIGPHKIQGIGANFIPKNLDLDIIDEIRTINDDDAIEMVRVLGKKEGLLLGISSGANIFVAKQLSKEFPDKKIVTVAPDGIEKYLSLNLFD